MAEETGRPDPQGTGGEPETGGMRGADGDPHAGLEPDTSRRIQLIEAAQAQWISTFTDLGGRNTLLYGSSAA